MSQINDFRHYVQQRYDHYLYATEKRGISYGEIAHIQGLKWKELDKLLEEIEEEEDKNKWM